MVHKHSKSSRSKYAYLKLARQRAIEKQTKEEGKSAKREDSLLEDSKVNEIEAEQLDSGSHKETLTLKKKKPAKHPRS